MLAIFAFASLVLAVNGCSPVNSPSGAADDTASVILVSKVLETAAKTGSGETFTNAINAYKPNIISPKIEDADANIIAYLGAWSYPFKGPLTCAEAKAMAAGIVAKSSATIPHAVAVCGNEKIIYGA